jgi:hypothetical protein
MAMKALKITGIVVVTVALIGIGLGVTGLGGDLFFKAFVAYNKPEGTFDPADAVAAPDYARPSSWAALPTTSDLADLVPEGVEVGHQGGQPVDVFFIHPTGFLTSGSWTSPMDPDSGTEQNSRWMMANQASAYNGCCNVYAPRYREANIFSYFGSPEQRDEVLDFAYQDVRRAFEYFIENNNEGRPFIIAGHSQGSHHTKRLLAEVIDTSDLHQRMVAAYMIGSIIMPVSSSWIASMNHITACESARDLHCVIHWDTMPEGAPPLERPEVSICTNPLSWLINEERAAANLNAGAIVPSGTLSPAFGKQEDVPSGEPAGSLAEPVKEQTWAQCKDGTLYVGREQGDGLPLDAMGTYHQLDYALFYMNIRNNAQLRSKRYLTR